MRRDLRDAVRDTAARPRTPTDFQLFPRHPGRLRDLSQDGFPTQLSYWRCGGLELPAEATHFGFVQAGTALVPSGGGDIRIGPGMYFALPGPGHVEGDGEGVVFSRIGYRGLFQIGGPVEETGRLRYIDGCTDSLLVGPVLKGDACLNLLHFPPGVDQTAHTHPSLRLGIVHAGQGLCRTPAADFPLREGDVFLIPADCQHAFATADQAMSVIAYHPDSDFGATHDFHPMLNRTLVDGVSARLRPDLQTRTPA
jgi:quercetin dioxygenase-like cupin family protein